MVDEVWPDQGCGNASAGATVTHSFLLFVVGH
jgi:hypothetical protein